MCLDAKTAIALVALIVSGLSLVVSGAALYYSKLQPGRLVGNLSYIVIWRFSSNKDGQLTDLKVTPALWLANVGVQPLVVSDIRLRLQPQGEKAFNAYPSNTVPLSAITSPSEFNEYGRLSLGGPFSGVSLVAEQRWDCAFSFSVPKQFLSRLVGPVAIWVEVKCHSSKSWNVAVSEILEFGTDPYHKRPMHAGIGVEGIHVYSKIWNERTREQTE